MSYNLGHIISLFDIRDDEFETNAFGSGHINDTFLVKSKIATHAAYLLQKINSHVFKDVGGMINNMLLVTGHLKKKVHDAGGDPDKEVLTLIPLKTGQYYCCDENGNYWRMTYFLDNTRSYDAVTSGKQAYQGGVAFGRFEQLLTDLDPALLIDTIPDFLNIQKRLRDFNDAKAKNIAGRLSEIRTEVGFLDSRSAVMNEIFLLGKAGVLPVRITHNDTKFNNILLNQDNNIQCVIDLDTVMPGNVAYDFGDAVRVIINTAAEDEADTGAIQLNISLFTEFTRGYLSEVRLFLTEPELRSLIPGVLLLPYMQSVRFLTDYLEGDIYYKVHFEGHNLQRARAQIQLVKLLELNREKLEDIIYTEWDRLESK